MGEKKAVKERMTGTKGCQVDACKHTACRLQCHSKSLMTLVPKMVKMKVSICLFENTSPFTSLLHSE